MCRQVTWESLSTQITPNLTRNQRNAKQNYKTVSVLTKFAKLRWSDPKYRWRHEEIGTHKHCKCSPSREQPGVQHSPNWWKHVMFDQLSPQGEMPQKRSHVRVVLFAAAGSGWWSQTLSLEEWINKIRWVHTAKYYTIIRNSELGLKHQHD